MEKITRKRQPAPADSPPAVVVGIGAGAGALKPLRTILGGLPAGHGVAVVLIHHPDLTKQNLLTLLRGMTALEVAEAADGTELLADRIYVVPLKKFLSITRDRLTLKAPIHCDGMMMPIDHFFCSLAEDRRNRCCGILLSGNSGDGTLGLSEIRAAGGRTIVEDPNGCRFPDMPQRAIAEGVADAVLPAKAIAAAVTELAGQAIAAVRTDTDAAAAETTPGLQAILDILRARIGHDFRCYKPGTLIRRIRRRMTLAKIGTMVEYARYLSDHSDEVNLLQKDLLIGVTDFFRQPHAWEALGKQVIARLLENAAPGSEIRAWVPGCSTGKEVYSLAMLLAEQVERSGGGTNFQIFATDADFAALRKARTGSYQVDEIGPNVSAERLKRFFSRKDGHYQTIKSIRERIIFAAQNITADPPFSRLDLIVCRNLLIYLDQEVQRKIIALFHFALREGGFLFLGNAETVGENEDLFEPVSRKWRIYRRIGVGHRVNVEIPARSIVQAAPFIPQASTVFPRPSLAAIVQQTLLDRFAPACVMIDRKLQVLYVHGVIENYLTLPAGELTTRVVDMAREGLRVRLRGAIARCVETGRTVTFTARTRRGEKSVPAKATVSPLRHLREADGLLLITFEDQHFPAAKSGRQGALSGDVRQLADELKITREELQSTIDQLEGSNDQLKASNEEVMATNEELQSANEEMETSKEELQSLNEELNTINARLQEKVDELESTNNDVVNLLASTNIATLFLDKQFRIKRFTPPLTRLMSLIPTDLGRPFADILLRFTDETLMDDARRVLVDLTPVARELRADDGRWYIRRIMPYRTRDDRIEGVVVTFVDVTELKQAETALREALDRATWLARFPGENPNPVMRTATDGTILYCNPAAAKHSQWACTVGGLLPEQVRTLVAPALAAGKELHREVQLGERFYAVTLAPFPAESYVNVYGREITRRRRAEEEIRKSEERLKRAQELAHLGSWELDLIANRLSWSDEVYRIFGLEPQGFAATYEAFLDRVHPDDRGAVDAAYSSSLRENRDTYEIEHRVVQKDTGAIRVVQERCHHYRDEAGGIVRSVGMVLDITQRKQSEENVRRQAELLAGVNRILNAALHSGTEEQLGRTSLAVLEEITGSAIGFIGEVGADGLLHDVAISDTGWDACRMTDADDRQRAPGSFKIHGIYGRVLEDGKGFFTNDPAAHPDSIGVPPGHPALASFLGVPLMNEGRVIGMIAMGNREGGYDTPQLEALEALAPVVVEAFQRARAEEALRRLNAELEERVASQTAEIRRTCAAVEAERQRFYDVLETLPAYVVLLTPDYRVPFANRTFRERFGVAPGKRCYEHLFGRTEPCEICETYTVLKTGGPHHWEWIGPDGRTYDVFDYPFTDSDGATLILEMGIDITEVKRAQAALNEANETLEQRVTERTAQLETARAEAEEGKRLLESVMEVLPVGMAIVDARGGNSKANRAFEEVWGGPRPPAHSVGDYAAYRAWWADTGEPVRPEEWASARAVLNGEAVSGQFLEIERFDGSRAFVLNSASPVLDAAGKIVGSAVAIQDVTALRRAEEALRESEKRVRLKLHSILSPEGDIGTLELADIIDVPAIQSLMDNVYALSEVPMSIIDINGKVLAGAGWQEICLKFHRIHPETCRHCLESDTRLSEGIPPGKSRLYRCKNNMWDVATPIMVGGKHVGNVFSGQFFFADEAIDTEFFRSQAGRYGFDEAEYIAALEKVPRLSREKMETGMAFFMKLAELISQLSYSNLALARLLAERKQAEEVLQERTRLLEAANRELEGFSYTVSHDLRAPLRAIDGYSRMILRKHADRFDEDALGKFNVIRDNTRMMGQLIDDLLAFSRLGRTELSAAALDMEGLIREVWEEMVSLNPDRRLVLKIAEIPPCRADRGLVKQVLVNLLANAIKFTRGRKEALIETGGHTQDDEIVYYIRDNGVGFDMQYHDKLFGVFQRLHTADEFEGTGVGLAIVQRIIHRHGGRVWAEADVGKGACFFFTLPR
ncbi:MAG: PocR ligand-binding domain-containing protein [Syntrophales bacterium]